MLAVFTAPLTTDTSKLIQRCAKLFGDVDAGIAVEFSPLGPISTIRDGMGVVRAAQCGGCAGLTIT